MELKGEVFRPLTGAHKSTFEAMAAALFVAQCKQKAARGKPSTLCIEDQLLMRLEYWREYLFSYRAKLRARAESAACRTINGAKIPSQKQSIPLGLAARPLRPASGLRHGLDRRNRNAHRKGQKTKTLLLG